jgi:hypothetical protein
MPCTKCGLSGQKFPKYKRKLPSGEYKLYRNGTLCSDCKNKDISLYYVERKKMVFKHYGSKCACCGEKEPNFLTIDHINNDGNKERWPSGVRITGWLLYSRIVKENYPTTYQILCMNCNFGKRMNGGICPHLSQNML